MSFRRVAGLLLLVCGGLWLPGAVARAGFIAMDTRSEVELGEGQVVLRVITTNRGDEPAFQVRIEALYPDEPKSSAAFERLEVGESAEHTFQWDVAGSGHLQRVIPILTHYADANYYALSALTHAPVTFGEHPVNTLAGRIDRIEANPQGVLTVRLRSLDAAAHRVGLRVVTPAELGVRPRTAEAEVPASGELPVEFEVENYSGLPGSTYGVVVVLREERAEGLVERAVAGSVRLTEPEPPRMARVWIAVAVGLAALVLVGWQLGAFHRLRRG